MPDTLEDFMITQTPTAERPLLGLTVLVVEDSLFACEALRLLCLRSGARIRRADSLRSAHRHLQVYNPVVVIVDLGLPDGSGIDLIKELANATPRVGVLLGISGDSQALSTVIEAGADGYLEKPIVSLPVFQSAILSHLPPEQQPRGLRAVIEEDVSPDRLAFRDDLASISDLLSLSDHDEKILPYIAQFLGSVAQLAQDRQLAAAAAELEQCCKLGKPISHDLARIAGLVQERLQDSYAF